MDRFTVVVLVRKDCLPDPRVFKESRTLSSRYRVVIVDTHDTPVPDGLKLRSLEVDRVLAPPGGGIWRHLLFKWSAVQKSVAQKPDVVHANDLDTLFEGCVVKWLTGARLVFDAHELFNDTYIPNVWTEHVKRAYWRFLAWMLIPRADLVITVNPLIASHLQKTHGLKRLPTVIYNAPETRPRRRVCDEVIRFYRSHPGRKFLVYTGALTPSRLPSFELLLDALSILGRRPLVVLVGIGSPGSLVQRVRRLGLEKDVVFLPQKPVPVMLDYLRFADAGFVALTANCLNNKLGAPNKLFDYIQFGLPVLAFDLPFVSRVLRRFGVGVVSRPDASSLSRCIRRLFGRRFKKSEFKAAQGAFNWPRESRKLLSAYSALLQERRAPRSRAVHSR